MKHAETLMDRILFLEGIPNVQKLNKINIGEGVEEQLKLDLDEEYRAVKRLNDGIKVCRDLGDNGTEDLLTKILVSEEEHVDWIETQLGLIKQLGATGYLAEQMKE
jgi:bacterioferritin